MYLTTHIFYYEDMCCIINLSENNQTQKGAFFMVLDNIKFTDNESLTFVPIELIIRDLPMKQR